MDHLLHIHHQSLGTNKPCGMIYVFCSPELCKSQPAEEIRQTVSVLCICSAEDECEWDGVDLCDSMCVFSQETGFVLSLRAGRGHLIDRPPCGYTIEHLREFHACVSVCVCTRTSDVVSYRMLLLSPSFTPPVHGYSRLITGTFQSPTPSRCTEHRAITHSSEISAAAEQGSTQ